VFGFARFGIFVEIAGIVVGLILPLKADISSGIFIFGSVGGKV